MRKRETHFFHVLKNPRMDTAERERVRETVFHHMEQHPVGEDALVRRMLQGGTTLRTRTPGPIWAVRLVPAFLSLVLLAGAGSASYAAEGSVPGEVLYPVKIHVNETVRTVIAVSPEQRVVWAAKRVERRLREAEMLAARGKLTQEYSMLLSERVATHSGTLVTNIQTVEGATGGSSDARIDTTMTLEGHDELLLGITAGTMASSGEGAAVDDDVARIIDAIRATAESLKEVSIAVEEVADNVSVSDNDETDAPEAAPAEVIETAKRRYEKAETDIVRTRALLSANRDVLGELVALQASRTLRLAETELYVGEEDLEVGLYLAATEHFLEAQRLATRVELFLQANIDLKIEVTISSGDGGATEGSTDGTDAGGAEGDTVVGEESTTADDPVADSGN